MLWVLLVLVILAALLAFYWWLCDLAINPKSWRTVDETHRQEFDTYGISDEDWEKNWKREDFTLKSRYGYDLHCELFPRPETAVPADGRERVAVIVHGHGVNRYCSAKYAALFRSFGFNVVIYDHRNCGSSGKAPTTMGYCEARDLCTVCDWVRGRFGQNCVLGTHGESMGAATVMLHSALDPALSFVVEDCGYSSLKRQLGYVMKNQYHLPTKLLLPPTFLLVKLRTGVWFQQVEPAEAVAQSGNTPMLFIHGDKDTYVPYFMLAENYAAKTTGPKMERTFPGAAHAESYLSDPAAYRELVKKFLEQNGIL